MKIGVIVDNELNDDKRVLREIAILKEAGYSISVLCFGFGNKTYSDISGIEIKRFRINRRVKDILFFFLNAIPVYNWLWSSRISEFLRSTGACIVHVHDLYMSEPAWKGIKKSRRTVKMILDLHENYPYAVTTYNWTKGFLRNLISQPAKWKKKEERLLSYPDKIVVLSEEFRDLLENEYESVSIEKFCVFPNVPSIKEITSLAKGEKKIRYIKKGIVVLYFGVVAERRGIFDAIGVFRNVLSDGYDASLLIIGPIDKKDRDRFFNSISGNSSTERITYLPWIDVSELHDYLNISDICLAPFHKNPQHESGVANKIYDYMAGSRPIIASDCLPQQALIEKYECGIVYRNSKEFTNAIIRLISDESLRKKMGENGYNAVLNEFNIEKKRSGLIDAYETLLNN